MRITKFGHACVRIEHEGTTLVLDPGMFTDAEALDGADAVLITHEHADHYSPDLLGRSDAPVFTIDSVAAKIREDAPAVAERITVVSPGQSFQAAGVPVTAVGEMHALIHDEIPRIHNTGYRIEVGGQRLFHPGDAITETDQEVDVLFVPVSAPWAASRELIDFARAVKAPRNVAIHDRVYSEAGSAIFDSQINLFLPEAGQEYFRLQDGQDL
jgi:L-ascorbate metabolism protein UlaG (beta-lactamase superfamily)